VGVSIIAAQHDSVLVVPREAIRIDDAKPFVLQVVGHELKRREVSTSLSNLTQVEVTHGLADKDIVAINSLNGRPITDGTQVSFK